MSVYLELTLDQSTDPTVDFVVTEEGTGDEPGPPLDLTGTTVEMLIKPHARTDDDDPSVFTLPVTITDAAAGECETAVPAAALAIAGARWWRLDILASGQRRTAIRGVLWVRDN
jgi:hypothetical protein